MGLNKMEEEFKSKLNGREITPSPHAWERLDALLTDAENKRKTPVFKLNWLYVAAGFIAVILVGTMFFKHQNSDQNTEVVVNVKDKPLQNNPDSIGQITPQSELPVRQQTQVASQPKLEPSEKHDIERKSGINETENKLAALGSQKPGSKAPDAETNNQIQSVNYQNAPREEYAQKTDPANDAAAQLASSGPKSPKTIKVDARSLLSQVDGELELSFREKVIKVARKQYQNVKVAVNNRNTE